MQQSNALIRHLFRTEYSKITAVLCRSFGVEHIEIAEDNASDTFLIAAETWGMKGTPDNPAAWLYTVAKNRAKDYLKHHHVFMEKVTPGLQRSGAEGYEINIDLSARNITDSQLQMMFAICNPLIPAEAQIGLSLRILCGFGIEEIADAFLTNKETINKRLFRAKEKLPQAEKGKAGISAAGRRSINAWKPFLTTLYLLFNEGYYSVSQNTTLRQDLCLEAMRLNFLLVENKKTAKPAVKALLALMCFHTSRFEARTGPEGELILYDDQDPSLWNQEMIRQGRYYLNLAAEGKELSKYHIEAAIAGEHTVKEDTPAKWETILQHYNQLLFIEYSPIAALNRTYALAKANGKEIAIHEAEKLNLANNHLYYSLLGYLYTGVDNEKAIEHLRTALKLAKSEADKTAIKRNLAVLSNISSTRI